MVYIDQWGDRNPTKDDRSWTGGRGERGVTPRETSLPTKESEGLRETTSGVPRREPEGTDVSDKGEVLPRVDVSYWWCVSPEVESGLRPRLPSVSCEHTYGLSVESECVPLDLGLERVFHEVGARRGKVSR